MPEVLEVHRDRIGAADPEKVEHFADPVGRTDQVPRIHVRRQDRLRPGRLSPIGWNSGVLLLRVGDDLDGHDDGARRGHPHEIHEADGRILPYHLELRPRDLHLPGNHLLERGLAFRRQWRQQRRSPRFHRRGSTLAGGTLPLRERRHRRGLRIRGLETWSHRIRTRRSLITHCTLIGGWVCSRLPPVDPYGSAARTEFTPKREKTNKQDRYPRSAPNHGLSS